MTKLKHKNYINGFFKELYFLHNSNPKAYMDLIKSMCDGSFDKRASNDTSFVSPETWGKHFSSLLGPKIEENDSDRYFSNYIKENIENIDANFDKPFTKSEFLEVISKFSKNKAVDFDRINIEI